MGILRTNTVSGIETPTPVTGSVVFDGDGDYLTISNSNTDFAFATGDFTIEGWFYRNASSTYHILIDFRRDTSSDVAPLIYLVNGVPYLYTVGGDRITGSSAVSNTSWFHLALCRSGTNTKLFINGVQSGSTYSDSNNYIGKTDRPIIGAEGIVVGNNPFNGYISNLRILKGTALYTSNFTPPTRELQRIGDTVLLCCNNPDSAGAEATGKAITVNGNAAASTFSPGLVRDFTYGTQFDGVSKFDTQGYFVPPSGTTEQRSRGRGVFGGGATGSGDIYKIDYVNISSTGNSIDFGDISSSTSRGSGCASSTRGLIGGGTGAIATIDYVTIATTSNSQDFGNLTIGRYSSSSCSSSTRGIWVGGYIYNPAASPPGSRTNQIDYVTIASLGNAVDFGADLSSQTFGINALSSPTRGIFGGGRSPGYLTSMNYITIATTGTITSFGNLTSSHYYGGASSSNIRGIFAGGSDPGAHTNSIEYITIATTGNAQDFGDLTVARECASNGVSNSIRSVIGSGFVVSTMNNTIDYVLISSTGNAIDFGDMSTNIGSGLGYYSAFSDSHGGIS